jgi:protein-glutamine gamma-glutamyltransferase
MTAGAWWRAWLAGVCVAAAAGLGGGLFAPVFGVDVLLRPVVVAVLVPLVVDAGVLRARGLALVRPVVAVVAGVAALAGVSGAGPAVVLSAARDGWIRTLDTTWPVGATPELMLFVPLLVLLAATLSVEVLRRTGSPLAALVPAVGVAGLAQAYVPAGGGAAVGAAAALGGLALVACALTSVNRPALRRVVAGAAVLGGIAVAVAVPVARWSPAQRPAAVLHHEPDVLPLRAVDPLTEIAARLAAPERVAFEVRTSALVDRWALVSFDAFDGANWTSAARYRPLGGELARAAAGPPAAAAGTVRNEASVRVVDLPGPWLPSRGRTVSVQGASVLVDPATGLLLAREPFDGHSYQLSWAAPDRAGAAAPDAAVDPVGGGPMQLGAVPGPLVEFARAAVGNQPPSLRTARRLERFFQERYTVATGAPLPTGHGYAQLQHFLANSRRGTSEQFAAAYVVLARLVGIPARLVVGFRQPAPQGADGATSVHNRDILAWPEVAVAGFGWVPLDPTSSLTGTGARRDAVAEGDDADKTPDSQRGIDAPPPPSPPAVAAPKPPPPLRGPSAAVIAAAVVVGLAGLWLGGVPAGKWARRGLRRRGAPELLVAGAWREIRDQLIDHRFGATPAMTPRDLARRAGGDLGPAVERLAACVDHARWSGRSVTAELAVGAWAAADDVRGRLRHRPRRDRLRAALSPRSLVRRRSSPLGEPAHGAADTLGRAD